MSFLRLSPKDLPNVGKVTGVSLRIVARRKSKGAHEAIFTIGADALHTAGLSVGDHVFLAIGRDEDAGRVAFEAGATPADGFHIARNHARGKTASARLTTVTRRFDGGERWTVLKPTALEIHAEPGRIVVTLPEALRGASIISSPSNEAAKIIAPAELGSGPMPSPHSEGGLADRAGETPCGAPEPTRAKNAQVGNQSEPQDPVELAAETEPKGNQPAQPSRRVPLGVPAAAPVVREDRSTAAKPSAWTPAEDQILRGEWAAGSSTDRIAGLLPRRSKSAIAFRASTLGLGTRLGNNQAKIAPPKPPKQALPRRVRPDEAAAIEAAIAAGKVTKCPPAYVGEVEGAKPVAVKSYDPTHEEWKAWKMRERGKALARSNRKKARA